MKFILSKKEKASIFFFLCCMIISTIFLVIVFMKQRYFQKEVCYYTSISNAEGLRKGSKILLSGIIIGEVGKMKLETDNTIHVDLAIYDEYADRITDKSTLIIERLYGIGEKRVQVVTVTFGNCLPEGAYIISEERQELLQKITELNFDKIIATAEKISILLNKFYQQFSEQNRIDQIGQVLDEIRILINNLSRFAQYVEKPLILLNRLIYQLEQENRVDQVGAIFDETANLIRHLNRFLSTVENQILPLMSDPNLKETFVNINRFLTNPEISQLIQGVNQLFQDDKLVDVLEVLKKLNENDQLMILVQNLSVMSNEMKSKSPDLYANVNILFNELNIVLKAIQKTWLLSSSVDKVRKELQLQDSLKSNSTGESEKVNPK
ncbi:MAG: MCE family protein [Desulfobacterales bacterium]|nr:MCE family protein [Desulfobacterales bacterium]